MATGTPLPADLPPTCEVRDWTVFGPGYHKQTLYTPAMCGEMGRLFDRLSRGPNPPIEPRVKVGHDFKQRAAESLGFPTFGTVTDFQVTPAGLVTISLAGVPAQIGAAINAGWIRDGSIEIAPPLPDPADARQKLHPVFTGVSLLGEEQPAVKIRHPIPRAVFADGREVPPARDVTPWLQVMSDVARAVAADGRPAAPTLTFAGKTYSLQTVCFSEMTAMTPDEMKAALKDMLPDAVLAVLDETALKAVYDAMVGGAQMSGSDEIRGKNQAGQRRAMFAKDPDGAPEYHSQAFADMPAPAPAIPPAPAPAATPTDPAAMMKQCMAMMSELGKRMSDLEAAKADEQKQTETAKMAAFSDRVEAVLTANAERFAPAVRPALKMGGLAALTTKTYGDVSGDAEAAFAAWKAGVEAMPPSKMFSVGVVNRPAETGWKPNPVQARILKPGGALEMLRPMAVARIRAAAAN